MRKDYKEQQYDIGVLIGRFQIPELHGGHQQLINSFIDRHKQIIIFIGVSTTLGTKKNPLDFSTRKGLFVNYESKYKDKITILPLLDIPGNDSAWSACLDRMIRTVFPLGSVGLYGGRDSFIKCYSGVFDTIELQPVLDIESTKIREEMSKIVYNSKDFRAGQIYQAMNQYPKTFPTVDIAVVKKVKHQSFVLMGYKEHKDGLCLPGGFVDPSDISYEFAAQRELFEELNIKATTKMQYVGSFRINDPRYTGEERVITSLYLLHYKAGNHIPKEEFSTIEWLEIKKSNLGDISDVHKVLFSALINYLGGK